MTLLTLVVLLAGPGAGVPVERQRALDDGRAVLVKHECRRCHTIDDLPAAARPLDCTSCHLFLKSLQPGDEQYKRLVERYGEPLIQRYQKNIEHLVRAPDLTGLARRVRLDYLQRFLEEPFDQRPTLEESMIRHQLTAEELGKVVAYFAAVAGVKEGEPYTLPPKPAAARVAAGRGLFLGKGCLVCHTYGNDLTGMPREALEANRVINGLAPNLRFVKERMRPDALIPWLLDPKALHPTTTMPATALSRAEAEKVRDYLLWGDPKLLPAPAPLTHAPPKLLGRLVGWAEVKERVLGKVCVHCHMNDFEKDTGPGNKGGLGYPGLGLAMRTYEALVNGSLTPDGKRASVLVTRPGEQQPRLLQVLFDRRDEEQRDRVHAFQDTVRPPYPAKRPGMPMGLPSMTDEEISLVATWISQGCLGPAEVTGKEGANDGFLVRDGPIKKNSGCEQRPPERPRPAWAYDQ